MGPWSHVGHGCRGVAAFMIRLLFAIVFISSYATAIPSITFPINSQVPPVARISTPWTFTFSASTFFSTSTITYTMRNAPSWLTLDGSTRTLSGTPPASDANTAPVIDIIATDDSGSVTMSTTLVVSGNPAPTINIPLQNQIENFGTYSAPNSILFYPSTAFTITFDPATFASGSGSTALSDLNHYAVTLDNTPLPSWISFDGSQLAFTGKTPDAGSLIQPPEIFGVQLIASDVLGFAGVAIPFQIVVENHKLAWTDSFIPVNATIGTALSYTGLTGSLQLDGQPAASSNISSITAQPPGWLAFDQTSFALSGTPPEGTTPTNFTVTATDIYQDTAELVIFLNVTSSLFSVNLQPLNITIGQSFTYNISSSIIDPSAVDVSVSINPPTSWINWDPSTLVLSGNIPSDVQPGSVSITVSATSKAMKTRKLAKRASDTQTFTLNIVTPTASASSSSTSTPTSTSGPTSSTAAPSSATSSAAAATKSSSGGHGLSAGAIAAIVVPITLLAIAILVCLGCCYRKRRRERARAISPTKSDISNPLPQTLEDAEAALAAEKGYGRKVPINSSSEGTYTDTTSTYHSFKKNPLGRRSQTMTDLSGQMSWDLRNSQSASDPSRSRSENALSSYDNSGSWRSTQDSTYPAVAAAASAGRMTRNFSRKHGGRLTRDESSEFPMRDSTFSFKPPRKWSKSSIQQTPEFVYDSELLKSNRNSKRNSKRRSNYMGAVPGISKRLSGIGHGVRKSTSVLSSSSSSNRFSTGLGHGHSAGNGLMTDNSWMTINSNDPRERERERRPQSTMSAVTESTDVLYPGGAPERQTIRLVSRDSDGPTNRYSFSSSIMNRPSSRRTAGSSPWFGGGSTRTNSRATSRKSPKTSYQFPDDDRPAVPNAETTNDNLERSILRELRSGHNSMRRSEMPRDVLGISYGEDPKSPGKIYENPQEGTRQLKTYVSQMESPRGWDRNSAQFSDNDSRFKSADHSPGSQNYEGDEVVDLDRDALYGQRGYGTGSPHTFRDSRGNSIRYGEDESPELQEAKLERPSLLTPYSSYTNQRSSDMADPNERERYVPGPDRRPISIDHELKKKQSFVASQFEGISEHGSEMSEAGNGRTSRSAFGSPGPDVGDRGNHKVFI